MMTGKSQLFPRQPICQKTNCGMAFYYPNLYSPCILECGALKGFGEPKENFSFVWHQPATEQSATPSLPRLSDEEFECLMQKSEPRLTSQAPNEKPPFDVFQRRLSGQND